MGCSLSRASGHALDPLRHVQPTYTYTHLEQHYIYIYSPVGGISYTCVHLVEHCIYVYTRVVGTKYTYRVEHLVGHALDPLRHVQRNLFSGYQLVPD